MLCPPCDSALKDKGDRGGIRWLIAHRQVEKVSFARVGFYSHYSPVWRMLKKRGPTVAGGRIPVSLQNNTASEAFLPPAEKVGFIPAGLSNT